MRVFSVALALPTLLVPSPGDPLDIIPIDASTLTEVVVDVSIPSRFAALPITPAMVSVDGGRVLSTSPIDPATSAVTIVVDDGETATLDDVTVAQAAAVELVRAVPDGATIRLATPRGREVLPTDDDATLISAIGAITGVGPAVALDDLVLAEARALAGSPRPDRHLVVMTSSADAGGERVAALREAVIGGGIRLDIVAPPGVEPTALIELSADSGGLRPASNDLVAQTDAVSRTIRDRVRVVLALDGPGDHELSLTIGGESLVGTFAAGPPPPPPGPPAPTITPPPTTAVTPTTVVPPPTVAVTPAVEAIPTPIAVPATTVVVGVDPADADGGEDRPLPVILVAAAVVGAALLIAVIVRRRGRTQRPAPALALPPGPALEPATPAAPGEPVLRSVTERVPPLGSPGVAGPLHVGEALPDEVTVSPLDELPELELVPLRAIVSWGHRRPLPVDGPRPVIDLNRACVDELLGLPGIGRATAEAIVDHRERHGAFGSVDDLGRVRGIGPSKVDGLRTRVAV